MARGDVAQRTPAPEPRRLRAVEWVEVETGEGGVTIEKLPPPSLAAETPHKLPSYHEDDQSR